MAEPSRRYDVVIMGGGPGGATLGALLARRSKASVAIVEKERFPREHIGESLSYRVIPALEASGALGPVLDSDCWHIKHGGYYAWEAEHPAATLFEHHAWERDGVLRWAIHCNRAEFDQILLQHARDCGVEVIEGVPVTGVDREPGGHEVRLGDGRRLSASYFVEASGRQTSVVTGRKRQPLSAFRNVALWLHVAGGRPAQALEGRWNLFRELDASPIGSFAFEHGWYWYIPVPREVDGARVLTHSLGLVTDPAALGEHRDAYFDPESFVARARALPRLGALLEQARPLGDTVRTATNYSMISERFCDLDERWLLLGDAAYFVDPLFSSGVAFATHHASSASLALRWALEHGDAAQASRDLWWDYDRSWHRLARSFALVIDQWYHAIAQAHPGSVYWTRAASSRRVDLRDASFQAVVDTAVSPDLVRVLTRDVDRIEDVLAEGPLADARRQAAATSGSRSRVRPAPGLRLRPGVQLGVGQSRGSYPPGVPPRPGSPQARYWTDPLQHGDALLPMYQAPVPAMVFEDERRRVATRDADAARAALARVQGHHGSLAALLRGCDPAEDRLLRELLEAGALRTEADA